MPDLNGDNRQEEKEWSFKSKSDEKPPQEDCKKISSKSKQQDNDLTAAQAATSKKKTQENETLSTSLQGKITNSSNAVG